MHVPCQVKQPRISIEEAVMVRRTTSAVAASRIRGRISVPYSGDAYRSKLVRMESSLPRWASSIRRCSSWSSSAVAATEAKCHPSNANPPRFLHADRGARLHAGAVIDDRHQLEAMGRRRLTRLGPVAGFKDL